MMREERVAQLESELSKYLRKRRILFASLFGVFFVIGIIFVSVREATKEVVVHGEGFFSYEIVTYQEQYVVGILLGFLIATVIGCFLFCDILYCRFRTTEVNAHYITVYRGMKKCSVFINGEEKDQFGVTSLTNVIDTNLPDETKISVAFSRSAFMIAHISFSDQNPPIDL